ncbi:MAG: hypothetical protein ACTSRP_05435 [Candidatus Helarchaeota archaeon]
MNVSRKELLRSKVNVDLLKLNFPALITILLNDYEVDAIKQLLKDIGGDMAESWLTFYTPKSANVKRILKMNTLRTFGNLKMKVKMREFDFSLIFYQCPLCRKDIEILSEIPYCLSIAGYYERYFNILASKNPKFKFKKIVGDTIKSISSGDKYCEHLFKYVEI